MVLLWLFEGIRVRYIVRKVTLSLVEHFGEKPHYSENEVTQAFKENIKSSKYLDFAFAMYCSLTDFGELQKNMGSNELKVNTMHWWDNTVLVAGLALTRKRLSILLTESLKREGIKPLNHNIV